MNEFQNQYPIMVEYFIETVNKYPVKVQMEMVRNVSILMAEMTNGSLDKHLKNGMEINENMVDMFAKSYIQNYCKYLDSVYICMGHYDIIPKINKLDPRTFPHTLIKQAFETINKN